MPSFAPFALVFGLALLAGCSKPEQGSGAAGGPPPAPAVTVVTLQSGPVPLVTELPGRTAPYLIAEVRPQVGGLIQQRVFTEGGEVKAGQLLYRIDAAPYRATHDSARASLARAQANLEVARLKSERFAGLVARGAVSRQANDEVQAAFRQAEAELAVAQAALERARIDLDHTEVKAPIAGRIGRSAVTQGALVTANQAMALAAVHQLDPIYVDLSQSSVEMQRIRSDLEAGRLQRGEAGVIPVRLQLEDGSAYPLAGTLAFSEVTVDAGTGSVTLRARFPNPDGRLLPGMYVRAQLPQGVRSDAILVPHQAVSRDARGSALVMVVGAEGKVEARPVEAVQSREGKWVVTHGLQAGERVIVEGLQRVRPGGTVQAQEAGSAPAAPAPASAR